MKEVRKNVISLRVSDKEREKLEKKAEENKMPLCTYLRFLVFKKIK